MDNRFYFILDDDGRLLGRIDAALGEEIPDTAVPVTRMSFDDSLVTRRGEDCFYRDGKVEFLPIEGIADRSERAWRDIALERVKWLRERHRDEEDLKRLTTLAPEQFTELLGYMQDLRDWPQSDFFPDIEQRPQLPAWIAEQPQ